MAGLIQQNMMPPGASDEDEANEMEPVQGPGPDGSPGHEEVEGEAPEPQEEGGNSGAEKDENYIAALKLAMQALYKNGAAEHVAKVLSTAKDKVEAMANTAYEMTAVVDERTEGKVPDGLFALLAMRILNEVSSIAIAAHIDIEPSDIATALKTMILRYLGEQGHDVSQLQQAMDQVDPNEFNKMAQQDMMPQEQGVPA